MITAVCLNPCFDKTVVVDALNLGEAKTKLMAKVLKALNAEKKALVVLPEREENVVRATANLAEAATTYVNTLNVYDILNANKLILTKAALALVEEVPTESRRRLERC